MSLLGFSVIIILASRRAAEQSACIINAKPFPRVFCYRHNIHTDVTDIKKTSIFSAVEYAKLMASDVLCCLLFTSGP
jgi:hypothetical protein